MSCGEMASLLRGMKAKAAVAGTAASALMVGFRAAVMECAMELPGGEMRAGAAQSRRPDIPRQRVGRGGEAGEAQAVPRRRRCAGYAGTKPGTWSGCGRQSASVQSR